MNSLAWVVSYLLLATVIWWNASDEKKIFEKPSLGEVFFILVMPIIIFSVTIISIFVTIYDKMRGR
jgi:hypothetical protein